MVTTKRTLILLLLLQLLAAHAAAGITRIPVPDKGIQPRAVIDKAGTIHLLYFTGEHGHGDLFYTKSTNTGATWSTPLRVNSTPGSAMATGTIRGGQIALGRNNQVHIAWNGASNNGPMNPESGHPGAPMLYTHLNASRTAFEPERNLMTHTFGLDGGGTVASDAGGNVYVGWHGKGPNAPKGEAGRQFWITTSHDDGNTFTAEHPATSEPTGACGCCSTAMMADSKGTLRALYRSATQDIHRDIYLLTSHDHGRSFENRKLHAWDINACPMSSMEFAEAAGNISAAWETGGQVYFQNLTQPASVPISAPGEAKNRKHPRLAIAPNGNMLMIWTEGTGWQRGGSFAWQLYDSSGKAIGEKHTEPGIPAWSFGAVVSGSTGFVVIK